MGHQLGHYRTMTRHKLANSMTHCDDLKIKRHKVESLKDSLVDKINLLI